MTYCFKHSPIDVDDSDYGGCPELTEKPIEFTCWEEGKGDKYSRNISFQVARAEALSQLREFEIDYLEKLTLARRHIAEVEAITEAPIVEAYQEKLQEKLEKEQRRIEELPEKIAKLQAELEEIKKRDKQ